MGPNVIDSPDRESHPALTTEAKKEDIYALASFFSPASTFFRNSLHGGCVRTMFTPLRSFIIHFN